MQEGQVAQQRHGVAPEPDSPAATPRAVETTPSIPLAPRLAKTRGGVTSEVAYHSRSRIGIDAETTRVAPVSAAWR